MVGTFDKNDFVFERTIRVHCTKCNEWMDEGTVEATNIEEDFQGRDNLTFICPKCETTNKSLRVG